MNILIISLITILVLVVCLILIRSLLSQVDTDDYISALFADAIRRGEAMTYEEAELHLSFEERVYIPIIKKIGEISERFTPLGLLQKTAFRLELGGNPFSIDPATFIAIRFIVGMLFGCGVFLFFHFSINNWPVIWMVIIFVCFTKIGFLFPELWLRVRISSRHKEVREAMPVALDLLTICLEAGLDFDDAMSRVYEKWENEISVLFGRCIYEIRLGKPTREALQDMADRIDLPEFTSFVATVLQSQSLGIRLSKLLRIQSDNLYSEHKERVLNELTTIDNWNKGLFVILLGPVFTLWFMLPLLVQIIQTAP